MNSLSEDQHAVQLAGDRNVERFRNNNKTFTWLRFVIHTTGLWPTSGLSDNHASVFAILENNQSVRINMKTDANDIKGVLVWSEHDYELSTSTIRYQDYRLAKEITIAQFYCFIREM
jgi:hypothetical protein